MKKLSIVLVVLLSFTMLFSLTACNNDESGETPPATYPYTVTFNTNGGSAVESKNTDVILYSPTSIKENYILEGWYFDSQKTVPAEFPLSVDSNFTLYAKWKETLESMIKRFKDYMSSVDGIVEKEYVSGSFSYNYEVSTIGKFITYRWEQKYTSSTDSSYTETYNYSIHFEFGDFTTAEGGVTYNFKNGTNMCTASSKFYSAKMEGNTWLLNLTNTSLHNTTSMNYTVGDIEVKIQGTLLGALNDIRTIGLGTVNFTNYILDYNYSYNAIL